MDSLLDHLSVRNVIVGYLVIGVVVCLSTPLLRQDLRKLFTDLKNVDGRVGATFLKPLMGLCVLVQYCVLWPIAWFKAGKSERKAQQTADAQLERLRPFAQLLSSSINNRSRNKAAVDMMSSSSRPQTEKPRNCFSIFQTISDHTSDFDLVSATPRKKQVE